MQKLFLHNIIYKCFQYFKLLLNVMDSICHSVAEVLAVYLILSLSILFEIVLYQGLFISAAFYWVIKK